MQIAVRRRPVYKALRDFSVGDKVASFGCADTKVLSIQKNGEQEVYKIALSDGRSFRCGKKHLTSVSFRTDNGFPVYDTLTADWISRNLDKYNFAVVEDPTKLTTSQAAQICLEHENEPADKIMPVLSRDKDKVYIDKVEDLGYKEEQWCLTLNDPLGLYKTADGVYTHNSTFTMLALLFVAASFSLMRDPWKFFNKSKTTVFAITLCAVTLTKAKEIYEEPIRQLIEGADFWRFCKTHKEMMDAEAELAASDTVEYIPWSNGGPQPLDSRVYLPDGSYKLMGDVKIGDKIASPTTKECTVIDIPYESSNDVCYEIELDDGRKCRCAAGHKWRVAWEKDENGEWIWRVVPVEFLIAHPEIDFEVFEGKYTDEIHELSEKKIIK